MSEHVALIGFMGAGKSTLGRRVARELGLPFVDSDAAIVERHGPIAEIFAREGDAGFRQLEYEVVRAPPAVLALGGGAVTHEATRALLATGAVRVFIDVPLRTLVSRLRRSRTIRPLLGEKLEPERVRVLWERRMPLYREAEIVVAAGGHRSQAAIAREIVARVRPR